jgi:hypothetical protein
MDVMKTPTSTSITSIIASLTIASFAFLPQTRADCREGCDPPNFSTFLGKDALAANTTGTDNTAIGGDALTSNTIGFGNTATGAAALLFNTQGYANTADGSFALYLNTEGYGNTAVGNAALTNNATGSANTAVGFQALRASSRGNNNTALGYGAGQNLTGDNNVAVGFGAGQFPLHDNNIDIGNQGGADDSGTIRIGTEGTQTATYIAGISATPLTHGAAVAVGITSDGQLGVRASSARFKEAIKPMDKASEAVLALQPVTFRYKKALDPKGAPQFGLVAEEVAKVNPDLVVADDQGKPFTVRYEEVNAMLLNEFLKEHKRAEEQAKKVEEQAKTAEEQANRIEAQASKIERLEAALEKMSVRLDAKGL